MPKAKAMAMKGEMMCDCQHHTWIAWVILIIGVLYLLQDLGVLSWLSWLNWYTALFVLLGLGMLCKCCSRGKWF